MCGYETSGTAGIISLPQAGKGGIVKAWKSNILEEALAPLEAEGLEGIPVSPCEIISLKLVLPARGGPVADWKQ